MLTSTIVGTILLIGTLAHPVTAVATHYKTAASYQTKARPTPKPPRKPTPTPTPTRMPTPTMTPTPTPWPTVTPTPTPTPTPTATPTPTPSLGITSVVTRFCSNDSSCNGWLTTIDVNGFGFSGDSRTSLKQRTTGTVFGGYYVGGNGSTRILTDFYFLPHCAYFDVQVAGTSGTLTAAMPIASICP